MSNDQEHQQQLNELCAELKALCTKHGLAGAIALTGDRTTALQLVIPEWTGALVERGQWVVHIDSSTDEGRASASRALDLFGKLHNLCADCATVFGDLYASAQKQIERAGGVVVTELDPSKGGKLPH